VLGGLPEEKMHCSVMGREALEAAVRYYRGERGEAPKQIEGEVVCKCFGVTDHEIERQARENGLQTIEQVTHYTKAGGACRACHAKIQAILDRVREEEDARRPRKRLTIVERIKRIEETLDREIRPLLQKDGGDVELVDVNGPKVIIEMRGMCRNCPSSSFTASELIQVKLREFVSDDIEVEVEP
jgi:NifU-like protein